MKKMSELFKEYLKRYINHRGSLHALRGIPCINGWDEDRPQRKAAAASRGRWEPGASVFGR